MQLREISTGNFETDFYPCPLCMEIHEFDDICIEQLEESLKLTFLRDLKDFNDEEDAKRT